MSQLGEGKNVKLIASPWAFTPFLVALHQLITFRSQNSYKVFSRSHNRIRKSPSSSRDTLTEERRSYTSNHVEVRWKVEGKASRSSHEGTVSVPIPVLPPKMPENTPKKLWTRSIRRSDIFIVSRSWPLIKETLGQVQALNQLMTCTCSFCDSIASQLTD